VENRYISHDELTELKKVLLSEPSNLVAANRYWNALGSVGGCDVRSGGFVIEAYRACALASHEGVSALARAYRQLYNNSGEAPRRELFDEELLEAFATRLSALRNDDRDNVEWILECVLGRVPPHRPTSLDGHGKMRYLGSTSQRSATAAG
jgi:hypothetical protein